MARLADIAALCGLSLGSVSRILNEDPDFNVPEETRGKVMSAADQLGYVPPRKRGPAPRPAIALEAGGVARPGFLESCARHLDSIGAAHGFGVTHEWTGDAAAVISIGPRVSERARRFAATTGRPLLLVDNSSDGMDSGCDRIVVDYDESERMVADHFKSLGIESAGYYGGIEEVDGITLGAKRAEGFRKALMDAGLYREEFFSVTRMDSYTAYHVVMSLPELPGAMVLGNSEYAYGAMRALSDRGSSIPCCVYQDFEGHIWKTPGAMGIEIYSDELWQTALSLLSERLKGRRSLPLTLRVPGKLTTSIT